MKKGESKYLIMNRIDKIDCVIQSLLQERGQQMEVPDGLYGKQRLMRALCNVRPPMPIGDETLKAQDEELQRQLSDKGVVTLDGPGGFIPFTELTTQNIQAIR